MASKWMSRKLVVAVTAVIAEVILGLGGSVELAQELSLAIAGIASAYLLGQSAVDAKSKK
jgi:ABC-type branched-subunit amino acid transport system permease subunit